MTGILRSIILGVSTAALFGGVAMTFVQAGALKEVVRLAVGVMIVLSLLYPISKIHIEFPAVWARADTQVIHQEVDSAEQQRKKMMAESTAKEIGAYLTRRAKSQGIDCNITVSASVHDDETIVLDGAIIRGTLSQQNLEVIYSLLESECGIPREVQTYVEE